MAKELKTIEESLGANNSKLFDLLGELVGTNDEANQDLEEFIKAFGENHD